jgi:membrane protease YdiL (CAAX protease family)
VNNSTSTTSAAWPTRWPSDSFRAGSTTLLVLAALGAAVVGLLGCIVYIALHRGALRAGPHFVVTAVIMQLVVEGLPVIVILGGLPVVSKLSLRDLGFSFPRLWQIGVAFLGAIAMVVVVEGGASLIQELVHQKHEQSVVELFRQIVGTNVMWFFAFFAIVLAPFMEEVLFRIFIFNVGLRWRGFWLAASISGICFGAAHTDPFVLLPLALGGIILCGVYYRTRNAFASMITHGLFNALTVFALIYAPQLAQ